MRPRTPSTRLLRALPHAAPVLGLSFALLASTSLTDPALSQDLSVQVPEVSVQAATPSLSVPTAEEARAEIQRTPGGVALIPDAVFRNTPSRTIKDIVEWTPGVIVQPRFGADARVSIRGSGLSRNYGNRGLNVFMDGIPVNTSDGLVDFFEIDPSAYRYVEVFKGSNALRLGGNSLGGAINLVTPTGRDVSPSSVRLDAGSYGYVRAQASTGGVSGPFDFFVTGSAQRQDGFREHSNGDDQRASGNIGYQFSPDVETRFYLNVNRIRQRIPGEVTQDQALRSPRSANSEWIRQDQARNIDSVRFANKTTLRFGATTVEFGAFGVNRHVMHPIYQYLDYTVWDYGGFARAVDDRTIGGFRNRLTLGVNLHYGRIDTDQYVNLTGAVKGSLAASMVDTSQNLSIYAENSFFVLPQLALVVGGQFLHAVRERRDRFLSDGDGSGHRSYDLFSPKVGILWDVDPAWQVYGNVSRSAEVPSFDANTFASPSTSDLRAQTATTYEVGTRGSRGDVTWDVSLYRSEIRNELQCLTTSPFSPCSIVNAGRTVHQGVEAGLGVAFLKSVLVPQDQVRFNAAYTLNDFFFDGDGRYGDNQLPGVPRQYLRAELLYSHPSGLRAGPNVEWAPGSYYADNANQLRVDPYALLNFRVSFDRGTGLSGYLEARNLTDKRYISSVAIAGTASAASEIFNPGTGRAVYGGLSYRW